MKSPFRMLARIAFLAVVAALLLAGLGLAWFTSWRSDKRAALQAGAEMFSTRMGPVEAFTEGEGPAVLVFHGAPGGYDQALLLGAALRREGFHVIAPSRPGYLRTPLETGLLPEQQADAMAGLLDTLGIESAAVLGFSEGAPAALFFALKYPERTPALALIAPVTRRFDPNAGAAREFGREVLRGLTGDVGAWVAWEIAERDPVRGLDWMLGLTSLAEPEQRAVQARSAAADPGQHQWYADLVGSFNPLSPRETGARNDSLQIRALQEFPLARMTVPTLLVHGALDRCVLVADSEAAAARIPGAVLRVIPGAGHLVQLGEGAEEAEKALLDFFRERTGAHGDR